MFYNLTNNLRNLYSIKDVKTITEELNKLKLPNEKPLSERVVKSWIMPSSKNKPSLDNLDLLCRFFKKSFNDLIY